MSNIKARYMDGNEYVRVSNTGFIALEFAPAGEMTEVVKYTCEYRD